MAQHSSTEFEAQKLAYSALVFGVLLPFSAAIYSLFSGVFLLELLHCVLVPTRSSSTINNSERHVQQAQLLRQHASFFAKAPGLSEGFRSGAAPW